MKMETHVIDEEKAEAGEEEEEERRDVGTKSRLTI